MSKNKEIKIWVGPIHIKIHKECLKCVEKKCIIGGEK